MLRAIRRQLRLIRYYSAPRRASGWTRAADVALAAGLLLGWPLTWTLDRVVSRDESAFALNGQLHVDDDGSMWALTAFSLDPLSRVERSTRFGKFALRVDVEHRGWPFTSSVVGPLPVMEVKENGSRNVIDLEGATADPKLWRSLKQAVAEADYREPLAPVEEPRRTTNWLNWIANTIIWSVVLPIVAVTVVGVLRLVSMPLAAFPVGRRQRLASKGRCVSCGYDLRASTFSANCPECGALIT